MIADSQERQTFGEIEIETGSLQVFRRGEPVELRPKEYHLLMSLARNEGQVVRRLDLLRDVWGYAPDVMSRTVDTHVAELRRKLEDDPADPKYIITVRKRGYRLQVR